MQLSRNHPLLRETPFDFAKLKNYPYVAYTDGNGGNLNWTPWSSAVSYTHLDVYKRQEEGLDQHTLQKAVYYISNADVLIIGGTSLTVYPAAGLIDYYGGKKLVLINKSVTSMDLSLIHI